MAPPPRLLQFIAVLLFLSAVVLLLAVSGVHGHGTRRHQADDVRGEHRVGIGGEMHHAVARWWSRTVVRRGGGGGGHGGHGGHGHGHGHGHGRGHGAGDGGHGTPAVFYPRAGGGNHRRSAASATGRWPSAVAARALLVAAPAAVVLLLLRR